MSTPLKCLFLSPEAVPFAKTGGLADVSGALPIALKKLGVDVRLVLPFYRVLREKEIKTRPLLEKLAVPFGKQKLAANIHETVADEGIPVYLIEREDLYDRPNLYGNAGGDYYDNLERFTFFAHCSLQLVQKLSFRPDIIHCHDWQTGLVPALIRGPYSKVPVISGVPIVFTIHNLGYQGTFPADKFPLTGLPREDFFHMEGLEFYENISLLKAGIVYSHAITTVSPTYAKEIQTPAYGMGMEGVLRKRKAALYGILNGVDYSLWDPGRDSHLPANYSRTKLESKERCKEALLEEMGLDLDLKAKPLLGMITRLGVQKGLDLLLGILDKIMSLDVGLVILGSGDEQIQQVLQRATKSYPRKISLSLGFNDALAHRIMAGSDLMLIPSRYEPCGLTQMYAMKYGTVPLVRATGGLEDTVTPFDPLTKEGTGFAFGPYDPEAFLDAIEKAVQLFGDKETWKRLLHNGMQSDFSWQRSARKYLRLYEHLIKVRTRQGRNATQT